MTQKILEIDVMVYNMTKNLKKYRKILLVTFFENLIMLELKINKSWK